MNRKQLLHQILKKESYLCVGLDSDISKIPVHLQKEKDPVFEFNRAIIDTTAEYAVAYKPNLAFYESLGTRGMESLEKTLAYIPKDCFAIADAKRGDIGNTSALYAKAFFENMAFDAVTVAPYMGSDSIRPFLHYKDKWVIVLGLTSNAGAEDFQTLELKDGNQLFEKVLEVSSKWGSSENMMYVVGATQPSMMKKVRNLLPDHFLLVPGVGAQGGSLEAISVAGLNEECGLLVNSSRQIIFASEGKDFASEAGKAAASLQEEMGRLLQTVKRIA